MTSEIRNLQPFLLLFFAAQYPETEQKFEAHFVLAVSPIQTTGSKMPVFYDASGEKHHPTNRDTLENRVQRMKPDDL